MDMIQQKLKIDLILSNKTGFHTTKMKQGFIQQR